MRNKIIFLILTVIAAAAVIFLSVSLNRKNPTSDDNLAEYAEQVNELDREMKTLEEEISTLQDEYDGKNIRHTSFSYIFVELNSEVYDSAYAVAQDNDAPGMLALSETQLPGMNGKITKQEFDTMLGAGWEACLYWNGSVELGQWLKDMRSILDDNKIEMPDVIVFGANLYNEVYDMTLLKYGINSAVIYEGDDVAVLNSDAKEENAETTYLGAFSPDQVWHINTFNFHQSGGKTTVASNISTYGAVAMNVGFSTDAIAYEETSMRNCLSYIKENFSDTAIGTVQSARNVMIDDYNNWTGEKETLQKEIDEKREELEYIRQERESLLESREQYY